jgi:hypothetical protein
VTLDAPALLDIPIAMVVLTLAVPRLVSSPPTVPTVSADTAVVVMTSSPVAEFVLVTVGVPEVLAFVTAV